MGERRFEANDKLFREKSELLLTKIHCFIFNGVCFVLFSSLAWSPFPKLLQRKNAIFNVYNKNKYCFEYNIVFSLNPIKYNSVRLKMNLKYFEENLNDIKYYVNQVDIPIFNIVLTFKNNLVLL